jgi:hypothetical protein
MPDMVNEYLSQLIPLYRSLSQNAKVEPEGSMHSYLKITLTFEFLQSKKPKTKKHTDKEI